MIKFSSSFKLNEIHKVDSPFNEDPKIINSVSREAIITGEGRWETLRKMGNAETSIVMQIGGGQFRKRISALTKNFDLSLRSSHPKIQGRIQKFFI